MSILEYRKADVYRRIFKHSRAYRHIVGHIVAYENLCDINPSELCAPYVPMSLCGEACQSSNTEKPMYIAAYLNTVGHIDT
jgi:hypothetical protein